LVSVKELAAQMADPIYRTLVEKLNETDNPVNDVIEEKVLGIIIMAVSEHKGQVIARGGCALGKVVKLFTNWVAKEWEARQLMEAIETE